MAKEIKNLLIKSLHDRQLKGYTSEYFSGRLIDIGCGTKPYTKLLTPYVTEHIGVDHQETPHDKSNIARFSTAYNLPAEEGEFDSALCTAVQVRFLRPIYDAPLDFRPWAVYGLRTLSKNQGFAITQENSIGNSSETAALLTNIAYSKTVLNWMSHKHPLAILGPLLPLI